MKRKFFSYKNDLNLQYIYSMKDDDANTLKDIYK